MTYKTRDTVEAATLVTLGYSVDSHSIETDERTNKKVVFFSFTDVMDKDIQDFATGSSSVEPSTFVVNFNKLKVVIARAMENKE